MFDDPYSMISGCSVALQNGNSEFQIQPYTYIDGLSLTMCMFMERCMESGLESMEKSMTKKDMLLRALSMVAKMPNTEFHKNAFS